jgi:hypothetical protein
MNTPEIEEKVSFPLGSIVLQYVHDDARYVGIIVGNHMAKEMNAESFARFENRKEDVYHICLVLGWFEDHTQNWSIFSRPNDIIFPCYAIGDERVAKLADFEIETKLLCVHREDARLRRWERLRSAMFGFSSKQVEILELVALADCYMRGGQVKNVPSWIELFEGNIERFFLELQEAIPLG